MVILDNLRDILLVSFGAVLGANSRFIIYNKFDIININKNTKILLINTFASFLLGFFFSVLLGISNLKFPYELGLFFSIGFLGSLSTFSTFIADLFELCIEFKFEKALKLFLISLTLGIVAFAFGYLLGN